MSASAGYSAAPGVQYAGDVQLSDLWERSHTRYQGRPTWLPDVTPGWFVNRCAVKDGG